MNGATTMPIEQVTGALEIELLNEEDLLAIGGGGPWGLGGMLIAGGAAAALVGVAVGVGVYLVSRALAN